LSIIWGQNPQLDKRLIELEAEGLTQVEIAQTMSEEFNIVFSRDMIKNRLARVPRNNLADRPITNPTPYFSKYEPIIRGIEPAPPKMDLAGYLETLKHGKKRALVLGDMHIPFQDEAKLQKAIDLGRNADIIIRNGDPVDMYSISKFFKEFNVPMEVEIEELLRNSEYLSEVFGGVPIVDIQSNHPWRVAKAIQMPMSLEFLVRTDLLREFSRPFPNVFAHDDWWVEINDTIFAHAEASSVVPSKVADDTWTWFKEWQQEDEMCIRPFRTLVEAHTHRLSCHIRGNGKVFEGGSLCKLMPYTRRGIKYRRPQSQGAVIITWKDGVSDLNQCREYVL
jgi:hypothetical protein